MKYTLEEEPPMEMIVEHIIERGLKPCATKLAQIERVSCNQISNTGRIGPAIGRHWQDLALGFVESHVDHALETLSVVNKHFPYVGFM